MRLLCSCSNRLGSVLSSDAKQYHAFARECLGLAEKANDPGVRLRLIELSREWMEAALIEERREASREKRAPYPGIQLPSLLRGRHQR